MATGTDIVLGLVSSVIGWKSFSDIDIFCNEWDVKPKLNERNTYLYFYCGE